MDTPTKAYDLLEEQERQVVDDYVAFVREDQRARNERIALALQYPIHHEHVRRSRGLLSRPIVRIAVAEKIQAAADEEDLNPARVIREHAAIAFSNMADYIQEQHFGDFTVKSPGTIPRDKMAAVKSLKTVPTMSGMRTEISLHDKVVSLKILAELMGLVAPDKPPVLEDYAKPKSIEDKSKEAPEKLYAELLEQSQSHV